MKRHNLLKLMAATLAAISAVTPCAAETLYGDQQTTVKNPEWMADAVIYEVNLRQGTPGRNLQSMRAELPRLKDLGVDVLWLMPIHPISEKNRKGTLGSYYAVADYKAVNPEFGTTDDLKAFVSDAHNLGMKVIIDEVCNHSGCDNPWLTTNPDFYAHDAEGNLISPFDWTDTYKLDYSNPTMREAMYDALTYWVKEADIDGYRFDVAFEVPTDFWEGLRPRLEQIKPVMMLAEASTPVLTLNAFDVDYNWPMKDVFNAIAATQGVNKHAKEKGEKLRELHASDIVKLLDEQSKQYPKGSANMNMITNHDLNSWEGTEFDRLGPAANTFAVLSYTLPGMLMMYTGQEVGFDHAFEFFETDPVQPDYTPNAYTELYKKLNALKHNHAALNAGNNPGTFTPIATGNDDVLAFERTNGNDRVLVIANLSAQSNTPSVNVDLSGMTDYFNGGAATLPATLQPWQYLVFTNN